MQYSVVNYRNLERTTRLDGEFYKPVFLEILRLLQNVGRQPIASLCEVSDGNHMTIAEYFQENEGIPYYRGQDVNTDFFLENSNPIRIPENIYDRGYMKRSYFQEGDVLLSIVGTIGSLSLVTDQVKKSTGSCKLAILRPKKISSEYLSAFLMCKYGNMQIKRSTRGAAQTGLLLEDMDQIDVFTPSEKFELLISQLVKKAILSNRNSKSFYSQAEQLLLSELGLLEWKPKHEPAFVKNYSDTQKSERFDADYFQPKYEEIIQAVKEYKGGFDTLENLTKLVGHSSNPPYETEITENKTFVITQKHLASYFPADNFWTDEEALYTTDEFIEKNKKFILQKNDVILYSVGAYIGKANLYNADIKATIGSFLTLIRPKINIINPCYLLVFLNSKIGHELIRRNSRGLAQQYIYPYDTKKVIVPILKIDKQKEIEKMILEGQKSNNLSKSLLEIAERGVEMAIENNEEEAGKWIDNELDKLKIKN